MWVATRCEVHCCCGGNCPVLSALSRLVTTTPNVVVSLGSDVHAAYGIAMHLYEKGGPRAGGAAPESLIVSGAELRSEEMNRTVDHGTTLVGCILAGGADGLPRHNHTNPSPPKLVPIAEAIAASEGDGGLVPHSIQFTASPAGTYNYWTSGTQGGDSTPSTTIIPVLEGCVASEVNPTTDANGITPNELFQMLRMAHAVRKELVIVAVPPKTSSALQSLGEKRDREGGSSPSTPLVCRFKVQKDGVLNIV